MQRCQHLFDKNVSTSVGQALVECSFGRKQAGTGVTFGRLGELRNPSLEFFDFFRRAILGKLLTSKTLEERPYGIELRGLVVTDRADDWTPMRETGDKPLGFELPQGFANGRSTNADHFAELSLDQSLSWLETSACYPLTQLFFHLNAQRSVLSFDLKFAISHMSSPVCDSVLSIVEPYMALKLRFNKPIVC